MQSCGHNAIDDQASDEPGVFLGDPLGTMLQLPIALVAVAEVSVSCGPRES